ncbi:MAG: ankyrin repeat domain-containing protein [Legionella sp.]|nr:MAG: ankyrin repeat domain-containing protein [Legionella sp.]
MKQRRRKEKLTDNNKPIQLKEKDVNGLLDSLEFPHDPKSIIGIIEKIPELKVEMKTSYGSYLISLLSKNKNEQVKQAAYEKFSKDQQLLVASAFGWDEKVQELLDGEVDPNYMAGSGATALYFAAAYGHENCATKLLNAGAKVDPLSDLYALIAQRKSRALNARIEAGLNPQIVTPLYAATRNKHLGLMKLLLKNGADVQQLTPYGYAFREVAPLSAKALKPAYLSEFFCGLYAHTAKHVAAINDDVDSLKLLNEYDDNVDYSPVFQPEEQDECNCFGNTEMPIYSASTPLHAAAAKGSIAAAGYLLQSGADVNAYACDNVFDRIDTKWENCGLTPLHLATYYGKLDANHLDMLKLLLDNGAVLNASGHPPYVCNNGYELDEVTALDLAFCKMENNSSVVDYLCQKGARMCQWDFHMTEAVDNKKELKVELLLGIGKHKHLENYLPKAIEKNSLAMVNLLIAKGAKVSNAHIQLAQDCGFENIRAVLQEQKSHQSTFMKRVKGFFSPAPHNSDVSRAGANLTL